MLIQDLHESSVTKSFSRSADETMMRRLHTFSLILASCSFVKTSASQRHNCSVPALNPPTLEQLTFQYYDTDEAKATVR